jgi:hypothetical protein
MTEPAPNLNNMQVGVNLEEYARDSIDDVIAMLDAEFESLDPRIDPMHVLVDENFMAEYPEACQWAVVLAKLITSEENLSPAAFDASYRSMHFARLVSCMLLGTSSVSISKQDFFAGLYTPDQTRTALLQASSGYFAVHKSLDMATTYFVDKLDPTRDFDLVADTVAGVTFKFIEAGERKSAIDNLDLSSEFAELDISRFL